MNTLFSAISLQGLFGRCIRQRRRVSRRSVGMPLLLRFLLSGWPNAVLAADFSGANLIGSRLTNADLRGANLSGANLTNADLSKSDLADSNITQQQLDTACGFETKLPVGLGIKPCLPPTSSAGIAEEIERRMDGDRAPTVESDAIASSSGDQ
jgi:hypothetical protein